MAGLVELEIKYQRLTAERNALGARFEAGEKNLLPQIKDLNSQIRIIVIEIESLRAVNSSGTVIADDQAAKVDRSNTQSPGAGLLTLENGRVRSSPDTTTSSNATGIPDPVDFGTDATLRPYIQTQGTAPGSSQTSNGVSIRPGPARIAGTAASDDNSGAVPGGQAGVGAASDDNIPEIVITDSRPGGNTNSTVSSLNSINFTEKLIPQDNVLDSYASYTYQASLYLMDKNSYELMVNTGDKSLSSAKLLVQSGGAAQEGRAAGFDLDYYIENIELKSFIAGKAVRLSHNVKDVKITVVEPNGITFIKNIDAAVQQFIGSSSQGKKNFTSQIYLLVIKFYGYDDQGNLVRGGTANNQTADPNAFVEKWYPLILTRVNFRVANKVVEYEIEAKAPAYFVNASQIHGTIPYNIELSGQTLKELLAGPSTYTTSSVAAAARAAFAATDERRVDSAATTPPANASAAQSNKKTVRAGLMTALTEYQRDLVAKGIVQYPNEYEIEFALDAIAQAKVTNAGLNIGATSMSKPGSAADQKLPVKQSMDPNSRVESATAGMQIVQFLDMLVRNSTYIKDQQTVIVEENPARNTPTGINIKNTAWYKISFQATAKMDQYDEKRNGYAYKIKYIVSPYKISQLNSPYFKAPTFNGVHKQYKYWFTGENTQVISYEENLNSLYYIVLTGGAQGGATSSANSFANNVNELLQYQPQTASGQSTMGADGRTLEPAANAADQLYSISDLKEANVTIIGDPAWLQQGEAFNGIRKGDPYYFQAFLADGTINFDSQQILFEIAYNSPSDYNLSTGLIEPGRGPAFVEAQTNQSSKPIFGTTQESRIYIAKEVLSHFTKGKFTQTLKGSLMVYYPTGTGEGRVAPQNIPKASTQAGTTVSKAPPWTPKDQKSIFLNPTPSSSIAKGVQQILSPVTNGTNLDNATLRASPIYNQARRGGASDATALAAARSASAAGTNNYNGTALPGIRVPNQQIVKDQ